MKFYWYDFIPLSPTYFIRYFRKLKPTWKERLVSGLMLIYFSVTAYIVVIIAFLITFFLKYF